MYTLHAINELKKRGGGGGVRVYCYIHMYFVCPHLFPKLLPLAHRCIIRIYISILHKLFGLCYNDL